MDSTESRSRVHSSRNLYSFWALVTCNARPHTPGGWQLTLNLEKSSLFLVQRVPGLDPRQVGGPHNHGVSTGLAIKHIRLAGPGPQLMSGDLPQVPAMAHPLPTFCLQKGEAAPLFTKHKEVSPPPHPSTIRAHTVQRGSYPRP